MTSSPPSSVNDPFAGMGFSASAGADSPMLGESNLDLIDGSEGGLSEPDSVQSLASLGAPVNTGPSLVLVTSHHLVCREASTRPLALLVHVFAVRKVPKSPACRVIRLRSTLACRPPTPT